MGRTCLTRSCADVQDHITSAQSGDHAPAGTATLDSWSGVAWTVYRGQAFDLGPWLIRHPGGARLARLALHRDCTALLESNHLRPEVAAAALHRMPKIQGLPVGAVTTSPRPGDSAFYARLRRRVRREVLPLLRRPGLHAEDAWAAAVTVVSGLVYAGYLMWPSRPGNNGGGLIATVCPPRLALAVALGVCGALLGVAVQHAGNHGAVGRSTALNRAAGWACDAIGATGLVWRYHHTVSHHTHCNDPATDQDVASAWPLLRLDERLEKRPWHAWQHVYIWAAMLFMQASFHVGDVSALLLRETEGTALAGATTGELGGAWVAKVAHLGFVLGAPCLLHGWRQGLAAFCVYAATQGLLLGAVFAVSHNVPGTKAPSGAVGEFMAVQGAGPGFPVEQDGASLPDAAGTPHGRDASDSTIPTQEPAASLCCPFCAPLEDWAVQQLQTSADWGGRWAGVVTGGLNFQAAHHLFPTLPASLLPAATAIIREEAHVAGLRYSSYPTFVAILRDFLSFLKSVGRQE